jgi:Uri superfamily endonuclease
MAKKVLKGTYCLIIHLNEDTGIQVGKLGFLKFKAGYYVYVGSALNSLESRIKRHLRKDKKLHWHVDYLTTCKNADVVRVVFAVSSTRWECKVASEISKAGENIPEFGCSDCSCPSHLFYFDDLKMAEKTCLNSFKKFELEANVVKEQIQV